MSLSGRLDRIRGRRPALDHLIRAFGRYQADGGDRLAAGVTYFGFLSFFPLLALAFSVLGFVMAHDAGVRESVTRAVEGAFPGLFGDGPNQLSLDRIEAAKAGAGILGLAGLLYAGLGWIAALREALRVLWHQDVDDGNLVVTKVKDAGVLVGFGLALLASVLLSGLATAATGTVLGWVGLEGSGLAAAVLWVLAPLLAVGANLLIFGWLFTRLPRRRPTWAQTVRGALLAAIAFEVLKQVGAFYLARTTGNPLYGTFAVVVGLLVWINLISRLLLLAAAWTVTAPYADDVAPSGTEAYPQRAPARPAVTAAEG